MSSVDQFFEGKTYAVAGASRDRAKYGNIVFRALRDSGRLVYPLNPAGGDIEGHTAYPSLTDLPTTPDSLSIITPPIITRRIVEQAIALGVKNIWMQPDAEDEMASQAARDAGIDVIDDGSCVLVLLARRK